MVASTLLFSALFSMNVTAEIVQQTAQPSAVQPAPTTQSVVRPVVPADAATPAAAPGTEMPVAADGSTVPMEAPVAAAPEPVAPPAPVEAAPSAALTNSALCGWLR